MVFYGIGENLEYDFEIAAGADPSRIRLRFDGADRLRTALNGDLLVDLGGQTVTQHVPVVYQVTAGGKRTPVHAEYQIDANRDVTLRLDHYDEFRAAGHRSGDHFRGLPAGLNQHCWHIGHDAQGFIYLAGNTSSADFVGTPNAFFGVLRGTQNAWLMKLNPFATSGDQVIVYSTYFGGSLVDSLKDMVVDSATGLVYLTGSTTSTDLLVTSGAFQTTLKGPTNGFVAVFDPAQFGSASLLYATYLGGTGVDVPYGIATHNGKAYVTGLHRVRRLPRGQRHASIQRGWDRHVHHGTGSTPERRRQHHCQRVFRRIGPGLRHVGSGGCRRLCLRRGSHLLV